jgi:hypothetical protein
MTTTRAAALAAVNMTSSVLIVLCNKALFQSYAFNYPLTLSFVHFLFTIAGVELCRRAGLVKSAACSLRAVLPISLAYVGFVVLTNIRHAARAWRSALMSRDASRSQPAAQQRGPVPDPEDMHHPDHRAHRLLRLPQAHAPPSPGRPRPHLRRRSRSRDLRPATSLPSPSRPRAAVTVSDVDVRPLGLAVGCAGVLVTSFYQVKPCSARGKLCLRAQVAEVA